MQHFISYVVFVGAPCCSGSGNLDIVPNGVSAVENSTQRLISALRSIEVNGMRNDRFTNVFVKSSLDVIFPRTPICVSDLHNRLLNILH